MYGAIPAILTLSMLSSAAGSSLVKGGTKEVKPYKDDLIDGWGASEYWKLPTCTNRLKLQFAAYYLV